MTNDLQYDETPTLGIAADHVRCVWSLRGRADGSTQPIISDGCVEIVLNLGEAFEQVNGDGSASRQPLAMVVGPTARPTVVRATGAIDVVGIRLQPWAGASVLGVSMAELRDQCVPLADVAPGPIAALFGQLGETPSVATRAAIASAAVRGAARRPIDATSRIAVQRIPATNDTPTVRELARMLGRTTRTLQRVFADDVGLAPKTLLRITRIQRALGLALSAPHVSWAAIAAHAGYHDQSHFVREFRSLVGCAPSEFRPDAETLTTAFIAPAD